MKIFYAYCALMALIIIWLLLKYRAETKLEKLRDYDRRCEVEAEREEREVTHWKPIFDVNGHICEECKKKDKIIKWDRFYLALKDEVNCILCDGEVECKDCKIYNDLLKEHGLDA